MFLGPLNLQTYFYSALTDTLSGTLSNLPNRYILLRNIENGKNSGQVCDFGDFHRRDHIESLLTNFTLKNDSLRFYSGFICEMLEYINKWIDNNGGEFILDETILEYR